MSVSQLVHHDAANLFPMEEDSIQELADDIAKNGQLVPIEIMDGKILDGRRRYAACQLSNVEPELCEVNPADPVAYVLSLNLHRRHLTESQRAMVGARVRGFYDKPAERRRREAAIRGNKTRHGKKAPDVADRPHPAPHAVKAREVAAKSVGASGRSVAKATRVLMEGTPEIIDAVEKGEISVSKAEQIVRTFPKEIQNNEMKRTNKKPSKAENQIEDDEIPKPDGKRTKAFSAASEAIDLLRRCDLILKVGKSNPYRRQAIEDVIKWLRNRLKEKD